MSGVLRWLAISIRTASFRKVAWHDGVVAVSRWKATNAGAGLAKYLLFCSSLLLNRAGDPFVWPQIDAQAAPALVLLVRRIIGTGSLVQALGPSRADATGYYCMHGPGEVKRLTIA